MNIVHVNSYFISNTLHYELVKELANYDKAYRQWIFVPLNKNITSSKAYPESANINFWITPIFSTFQRYIWPLKIRTTYRIFLDRIKPLRPDITHSHSLISNGIISYMYYKKNGTPYVVTVRNTDINVFMKKSFFFRWLGYRILENSSGIVVLSPSYKHLQLKNVLSSLQYKSIKDKIQVIPNGVDGFWIDNRYFKVNSNEELQILFVGKLRPNKNILGLIESCKILKSKGVKFKLHIVGDGYLRDRIANAAETINCNIHGFISDKEQLLEIYRKCDLLVVPSFKESFGLIYAEAMTQGLPVIYTKGQGFDGNFPEGHVGFSVDPNSPENISDAILRTKENLNSMSKNAYEAASTFSWRNNSTLLNRLYQSVL